MTTHTSLRLPSVLTTTSRWGCGIRQAVSQLGPSYAMTVGCFAHECAPLLSVTMAWAAHAMASHSAVVRSSLRCSMLAQNNRTAPSRPLAASLTALQGSVLASGRRRLWIHTRHKGARQVG